MDAKRKEFIKLGWQILEAKVRYYQLDAPVLQDHEYDQLERRYDALAKELGEKSTAADMIGVAMERPSVALVADRVLQRDPPVSCKCERCTVT